jgi:hypothetical protein
MPNKCIILFAEVNSEKLFADLGDERFPDADKSEVPFEVP